MTLDEKRKTEAALTGLFVRSNKHKLLETARFLAGKFSEGTVLMDNFYLKGGNAFFILSKTAANDPDAPEGDYDFQFVPEAAAYRDWENSIRAIDQKIITALKETVQNFRSGFNTDCFKAENIIGLIQGEKSGTRQDITIKEQESVGGITLIGKKYMAQSYIEVAKEALKQDDKRVKLDSGDFIYNDIPNISGLSESGDPSVIGEPSIYVNYTIPGFVLYRMVCKFRYKVSTGGKEEEITLKSEIIDISVPRAGSGEVYMSQNGVITHFREKDGFNIPGWGYHLYENINLLQEIALGVSGSAHKKEKREDRLKKAAEILIKANGGPKKTLDDISFLLNETISEPYSDTESKKILGYYSALIYSIKDECTFKNIIGKIYGNCVGAYFSDLYRRQPYGRKWEALYKFKLNDGFALTVSDVNNAVSALINGCKVCAVTQNMSPFLSVEKDCVCAFDYAEVGVSGSLYESLRTFCADRKGLFLDERAHIADVTDNGDSITVTMTVNKKSSAGVARVLYVIIRKQNAGITPQSLRESAKKMLTCSILESQRYSLTRVVQSCRI